MARRAKQASQAKQNKSDRDPQKLTFLEHFYELRKRLFWVVLMLVFTTSVGLEIKDQLIQVIMAPLKGGKLVYLTPGGGFSFIFTLSIYFGVLLTIPVITYQIYRFLQPMLQDTSQKFVMTFIGTSSLLAAMGASLAYFLAIPGALGFLDGFAGSTIVPNLTADSYLTFVTTYVVGLAALFQLPLLMFLYDHIRPIPPGALAKSQRYGIVATTVLAAFITPSPDLLNYSIVLFPLLAAYEIGVLSVYVRRKAFRNKQAAAVVKPHPPKTVLETEQLTDEAPLTAIMEEIASNDGSSNDDHPEQAVEQPVAIEPEPAQPLAESVQAEQPVQVVEQPQYAQQVPAQQVVYAQPAQAYTQPQVIYVQQPQPVQYAQPVPVQQVPTQVQQAPLTTAGTRGRSVDGMRAPARYKTNVHVPSRDRQSDASQNGENSVDGLLTAQA